MGHPTDPCSNCGQSLDEGETVEEHESKCIFTTTSGVTFCDADRANNVWVEGADANGNGGVCLLDTMTRSQIENVLQRDDRARADLKKVTTNADLHDLADTVKRLETAYEGDKLQSQINRNSESLVMFTHFRGQPPFNQ